MTHRFGIVPKVRRALYPPRISRFYHSSNANESERGNESAAMEKESARVSNRARNYKTVIKNPDVLSTIPRMGKGVLVGQYGTMTRTYTSDDVDSFSGLSQDFNPLHSSKDNTYNFSDRFSDTDDDTDELVLQKDALESAGLIQFQPTDGTRKALVHGVFVSSMFSSIFAHISPGCVYINQTLDFVSPVFVDDTVVGCVHIDNIRDWRRRKGGVVAKCKTRIYKLGSGGGGSSRSCDDSDVQPMTAKLCIKGHANVWLPIGYPSDI